MLLLWHNHTMLGCGFDSTGDAPIVVCDFAWAHQGHKGDDAWEANLKPRSGATQSECRQVAEAHLLRETCAKAFSLLVSDPVVAMSRLNLRDSMCGGLVG